MDTELLLWIAVFVALIVAAPLLRRLFTSGFDEHRYAHTSLAEVRRMNWWEFEHFLGYLFTKLGYQATVTRASGDFGVDVLVTAADGTKIAVQAKHWRSEYVGVEHVLKTVGGAAHYGCQQAIVVTTSGYTDAAREASRTTGVELWGPNELAEAMERAGIQSGTRPAVAAARDARPTGLPRPKQPSPPAKPLGMPLPKQAAAPRPAGPSSYPSRPEPQTDKPTCPKCGKPMEAKVALQRTIWLCSRFPQCNGVTLR